MTVSACRDADRDAEVGDVAAVALAADMKIGQLPLPSDAPYSCLSARRYASLGKDIGAEDCGHRLQCVPAAPCRCSGSTSCRALRPGSWSGGNVHPPSSPTIALWLASLPTCSASEVTFCPAADLSLEKAIVDALTVCHGALTPCSTGTGVRLPCRFLLLNSEGRCPHDWYYST